MEELHADRLISGLPLRYVLTLMLLQSRRPLQLHELLGGLRASRLIVRGRPSKTISDALRWEVRKGRVRRLGRGRYEFGRMPRSTEWWIRTKLEALGIVVVAPTLADLVLPGAPTRVSPRPEHR